MVLKQRQEDFERQKINVIIELRGQVLCGELKTYMYLIVLGEYVYTGQKHSVGLLNSEYYKEMFSIPIINFKPWLSLLAATVLGVIARKLQERLIKEPEIKYVVRCTCLSWIDRGLEWTVKRWYLIRFMFPQVSRYFEIRCIES